MSHAKQYSLTGNPFVDTGLFIMQAHASRLKNGRPVDPTKPEDLREVMNDENARWLAKANQQLNSFFRLRRRSSALVNLGTHKNFNDIKQHGRLDEQEAGWKSYLTTLANLRDELLNETNAGAPLCESCGERPATKVVERVTRSYFPLASSPGREMPAGPAGNRALLVCPLCLIAIQWLPLGATVFNGKLACVQFTEPMLTQSFVADTYQKVRKKVETLESSARVLTVDRAPNAMPAAQILIAGMRRVKEEKADYVLPEHVTLKIWTFANLSLRPDCEVYEIHNPALQFLWEAAQHHAEEISALLEHEDPKKPASHLLPTIERQIDYSGFYPHKAGKGWTAPASPALYELYQTRIRAHSPQAIAVAKHLAALTHARLAAGDKKEQKLLAQVLKENPRWAKDKHVRAKLRKLIVTFAEEGQLTLEMYASLFPAANRESLSSVTRESVRELWRRPGAAVRATCQGWDIFWFYLHHAANATLHDGAWRALPAGHLDEDFIMFTNPRIQQFARHVFAMQLERRGSADPQRGLTYIKRHIVDAFSHGKITNLTLRHWFCLLAETHPEYGNEDFDALCRDEEGHEATDEMRFQMRLEMVNLYRETLHAASTSQEQE